MIDFHSHCLPAIDDGSKDVETSVGMLVDSMQQGVDTVIATPHFYPDGRTIEQFVEKRQNAYNLLKSEVEKTGADIPEIVLGCEVRLGYSLPEFVSLEGLCIGDTNYLLLEMPYEVWNSKTYELVYSVIAKYKVCPVIAHIERYLALNKSMEAYEALFDMDVLVQANADGFLSFSQRRFLSKLLDRGYVHVIGSDMHNMTSRRSRMAEAIKKIQKKFGQGAVDVFDNNARRIINNQLLK